MYVRYLKNVGWWPHICEWSVHTVVVCVCVCECVCVGGIVHEYLHTHTCRYIRAKNKTHVQNKQHTYIHRYTHTQTNKQMSSDAFYAHSCVTYIHTHIHIYTDGFDAFYAHSCVTYIHIYIHTHIHIYTDEFGRLLCAYLRHIHTYIHRWVRTTSMRISASHADRNSRLAPVAAHSYVTYIHTYIHTYVTYIHIYTHIHTQMSSDAFYVHICVTRSLQQPARARCSTYRTFCTWNSTCTRSKNTVKLAERQVLDLYSVEIQVFVKRFLCNICV